MSSELEKYKLTSINTLTQQFNASLVSLRNQLVVYINQIHNQKISRFFKLKQIDTLKNNYNKAVAKVTLDYNNNKNNINSLTQLPVNKYGLLIGINYIGTPYQLFGCINDTNNIKDCLQQKFSYNNFTLLTDQTNTKPTKINILNSLTNLLVNSKKGDSLFFLFSGHGTNTIDLNNDETDGRDEMIVPLDGKSVSSCILDDQLNNIIRTNLKEGVKLFMLFDCCFSGTVVDLKYNYIDANSPTINPNVSETRGQVIMISGCKDHQTSADAYVNYNGKNTYAGAMTFCFLKTIQDLGTNITLKTLLQNMRTLLKQNEYAQIPQLSSGTLIDINTTRIQF